MNNMNVFRLDRSWTDGKGLLKKGGGVAVYVNARWSTYTSIDINSTYSTPDIEALAISVKKPGRRHMWILTVYRPPNGNISEFLVKLNNMVTNISQ